MLTCAMITADYDFELVHQHAKWAWLHEYDLDIQCPTQIIWYEVSCPLDIARTHEYYAGPRVRARFSSDFLEWCK